MKHFVNLKDIPANDLRKIITDAKKRKALRKKLSTLEIDKGAPLKGKILIQMFEKASLRTRISFYLAIKQLGGGKYAPTDIAGKLFIGSPSSPGFGNLESGYIEGSNVDITTEMTNMIRAQQQFNGAARIMQTNSDMIEKMTR